MTRWHEPGCRKPAIVCLDGIPYCEYCFAFGSVEPSENNTVHLIPSIPEIKRQTAESTTLTNTGVFPSIADEGDFRLVRIDRGHHDDPIHVFVETASMRRAPLPAYDILSYARLLNSSDGTRWSPMYVGNHWDILYVPFEYEALLRNIRHGDTERVIWVDFLCVNQADIQEKTRQGMLIPELLMAASMTLMCPGGETAGIEAALSVSFQHSMHFSPPDIAETTQHDATLECFFAQDYFSNLNVVQEVVLAQRLTIVLQTSSLTWTPQLASYVSSKAQVPPWLLQRDKWRGFTGTHLLHLLLSVSSYRCPDPRDKVFGVLGLLSGNTLVPDYTLSVEETYIRAAACLMENLRVLDVVGIAASQKKGFALPSWVPDWSEAIKLKSSALHHTERLLDDIDDSDDEQTLRVHGVVLRIIFETCPNSNVHISVDTKAGIVMSSAYRLCQIEGEVFRSNGQSSVRSNSQGRRALLISQLNKDYEIGHDFVFLLCQWEHPIVLRYNPVHDLYSVVSTCELSLGPEVDVSALQLPLDNASCGADAIGVREISQIERSLMEEFYTNLKDICTNHGSMPGPSARDASTPNNMEAIFLDFVLLSLTEIFDHEAKLSDTWIQLDRKLGWMFLDPVAVQNLVHELRFADDQPVRGEGNHSFDVSEANALSQYAGEMISSLYTWDLQRFCQSFMRGIAPLPSPLTQDSSPMLSLLRSGIAEIQKWCEVSEQLLALYNFTGAVFKTSWPDFPGKLLAQTWCDVNRCLGGNMNPDTDRGWDWAEFRAILNLRAKMRELRIPQKLRPASNENINTRLMLRLNGLDLSRCEGVRIS